MMYDALFPLITPQPSARSYYSGDGSSGFGGKIPSNDFNSNISDALSSSVGGRALQKFALSTSMKALPGAVDFRNSFIDSIGKSAADSFGLRKLPSLSTTGSGAGASTAKEFDYYMADLARRYGMDRSTAYNEALANTSYQRAVADMQQAGLNPAVLFGNGRVNGASSPYTSGGYTSASGNAHSGNIPGWMYYGVTAIAQIAGTFASKNPMVGYSASMIAQNVMKALNNM